jgi:hypothetical protein
MLSGLSPQHLEWMAMQGTVLLGKSAAASLAGLVGLMRGPTDRAAQPGVCATVSVAFLTELYLVRADAAVVRHKDSLWLCTSTDS